MYTASDLRKGLKIQIDGEPYIITEFDFSKPGKGQALYRTKNAQHDHRGAIFQHLPFQR